VTAFARASHAAFKTDARTLAKRLLGQRLIAEFDGSRAVGVIVETEAYLGAPDLASHAANGRRTARNETMYGRPGLLYVYFTYGMHHCCNVVCKREGIAEAVLIRALEPVEGLEIMRKRRESRPRKTKLLEKHLCAGPGRVCEALGINLTHDATDLVESPAIYLEKARNRALPASRIESGPRIGLGDVGTWKHEPLRYWVRGSQYVSR
jgi:DNA-3-methyladenine glycosylase